MMKIKRVALITGIIVIMLSIGLLAGCDRVPIGEGAGNQTSRDYDYTDFTAIHVEDDFDLDISYAATFSITITGGENIMKRLEISQSGDTLKLGLEGGFWFWNWHRSPKAVITLPDLRRLDVGGASEGTVNGFKSDNTFSLTLSGASKLDIDMETGDFDAEVSGASDLDANMKVAKLDCTVSGASTLSGNINAESSDIKLTGASDTRLAGSSGNLILSGSGASSGKLANFSVTGADIELSGASNADVDVSGKMDVTLSGASDLNYYGNPTLGRTDISGSSDLNHKTRS